MDPQTNPVAALRAIADEMRTRRVNHGKSQSLTLLLLADRIHAACDRLTWPAPVAPVAGDIAGLRAALESIAAQDDEEASDSDLMQHDRRAGQAWAFRFCANVARDALAAHAPVAEDYESKYATAERLAKPAATVKCDFCGVRPGELHAFDCTALDTTPPAARHGEDIGVGVDVTAEGAHVSVRHGDTLVYSHFHEAPAARPSGEGEG